MIDFQHRKSKRNEPLPPLRERLRALRLVPRFLRLVWSTKPSYAVAIFVVRTVSALGPLAMLWIGKLLIDGVIANIGAAAPDWGYLLRLVALELGIVVALDVLGRVSGVFEGLLSDLFAHQMSVKIMQHAGRMDLEQFEDPEFYDRLQRARRHTAGRIGLLSMLLQTGQQLITAVTLLGAIIAFNPWLIAILVIAVLPGFWGETHFAARAYSLFFQWTPERRELDYLRAVAASTETAKEIKLFGLSDFFITRYADLATRYYRANREMAIKRSASGAGFSAFSSVAYYGAVALIVVQAVAGAITVGELTFLVGAFERSRGLIAGILRQSAQVYEEGLFLRDLFSFLEMEPRTKSPPNPLPIPRPIRSGFVFEEVGFRYPAKGEWALRHVSFTLGPGERIALVGENGAGKTTLVKLLTRLYDPSEGRILLDGVDLREYDLDELRAEVGVIFQDFVRYDMIARENIGVGRIDALDDDARIQEAASKSLALPVVAGLEKGMGHMLGRRFDGGANLSGGEWQKIALARAYMRDAQVLVLDEPTASLDARAEYQVFQRFSELTAGRMAVLISHRFSTVRMADRILVLEGGRVLEDGSHESLVAAGGRYAELFSLQAAGYR
jgi:ATP-binding cassette subfamily B protein